MGEVWLGKHLTLHTEVAVKFVTEEYAQNPAIRERFAREAAAAAKVKSPHIVQVFDHGFTPDDSPYIVMELLQGEELNDRLQRTRTVSLPELVAIVRQTCKGLSKAHQAGIVHRDIKPHNVFLTEADGDVFVKVLDFGIAKEADQAASSMTQTGSMLGTPYYMSPEQIQNSKNVRFDLWALAVLAYEALTGAKPFDGESIGAISFAIFEGTFAPPSTHVPGLPASIDSWFMRAFAKRPADRFQSAREFADAFVAAVPADSRSMRPGPMNDEHTAEFPVISPKNMPSLEELAAQAQGQAQGQGQGQGAQPTPFDRTKILGTASPVPGVTPAKNIDGRTALSARDDDSSAAVIGLSATIHESVAKPPGAGSNKPLIILSAVFVAIGVAGTLVVLASRESPAKVAPFHCRGQQRRTNRRQRRPHGHHGHLGHCGHQRDNRRRGHGHWLGCRAQQTPGDNRQASRHRHSKARGCPEHCDRRSHNGTHPHINEQRPWILSAPVLSRFSCSRSLRPRGPSPRLQTARPLGSCSTKATSWPPPKTWKAHWPATSVRTNS